MSDRIELIDSSPRGIVPFEKLAIRLHPDDDVAVAKSNLQVGTTLDLDGLHILVQRFVQSGHKIALHHIAQDAPVRRYGQIIGFATELITQGDHVHSHNIAVKDFDRDYAFAQEVKPVDFVPESQRRAFMGYAREGDKVGTRNYIAVISSVNCSAHTTREIAHYFTPEKLKDYPNVDGVIPLCHLSGCGNRLNSADYVLLQRTLAGMANHPNVGGYVMVGLGCETNQMVDLIDNYDLNSNGTAPPHLTIQDSGGIRKTVAAGIAAVEKLLPKVNKTERTPQPISALMLALQCGGSDGWSGITANPALGLASDMLIKQGGTVVLAETPEIYGAEHLMTCRATSAAVGYKLVEKVKWWEHHTEKMEIEIDNNPSPGNKAGGLTTIYEKSLGAVAKGGNTPLTGVFDYAEPVNVRGFTFMDSPGYDPVSVTGQVAGGSNLVVFTTGRGSVFGFKPAPSIKVSTNSAMYAQMEDDMDINAGKIVEGVPMQELADEIFEFLIRIASGEQTKSEAQGVGEEEFNPWNLGGTL